MGDKMFYIITTYNGLYLYKYIFEYEIFEYFKEPKEMALIARAFYEKSGISKDDEKVLGIDEADFVRYIA